MDWFWNLVDTRGVLVIEVLVGLVVFLLLISMLDGSKHRDDGEPPDKLPKN